VSTVNPSLTEDQITHRRAWALWHLQYAAEEYRRQGHNLEHFTQKAFEYGCTADEVAQILAANQ
jgi:hypothetical protein